MGAQRKTKFDFKETVLKNVAIRSMAMFDSDEDEVVLDLQQILQESPLSDAEIADISGIARSTVKALRLCECTETGEAHYIYSRTFSKLCKGLGLVSILVDRTQIKKKPQLKVVKNK